MTKQQLASKIWESANKMRSKIEANDYKDYILGFIFYKFLSEKEEAYEIKNGMSKQDMKNYLNEEDEETVADCKRNLGYFIVYENLFSTWIDKGSDFDVSNVTDALSAFSRLIDENYKKVFDKIFDTLDTGLSKLGDSSGSRTKAISGLIYLIKDIPMDGKQDYDVLGFIYEYLISQFAANAGKKAGEFYTPHEVSELMSDIVADHLQNRDRIEIYDPTSGSGSLLINIGKSVAKHIDDKDNIKYYAQELKANTYNLTRMNLVMRGIKPANIMTRNGDTLADDWPEFDENDKANTYHPLYVDAVVSNPPYSQPWDPSNKDNEPRYKDYGVAPKSKADYAFLLHDLFHVKPDGIMTIVLPHGVLFRGGSEENIRKHLIERNNIDAIIGLPANIFFGTGIPTIIMVLKQKRANTDILIIDASKGFMKVGKNNLLQESDIKRISDVVKARISVPKFSKVVSKDEIRANSYNLNIPRYVDSSEKAESYDIYASMFGGIPNKEVNDLSNFWNAFPSLKDELFIKIDTNYSKISSDLEVNDVIAGNKEVQDFKRSFDDQFKNFTSYLDNQLIKNISDVNTIQIESVIADNIFSRLRSVVLIDKYDAYQFLIDKWGIISNDIEIIQTEGLSSLKVVKPNLVIKKKDDREVEVQEGYNGLILPFELIQNQLLSSDVKSINDKKVSLESITANYEEILESLSEDDKEGKDYLNDDNTGFVPKNVAKFVKSLDKKTVYAEDSLEGKLIKVSKIIEDEKLIKKQLKNEEASLIIKTKETIESLDDKTAIELLSLKWNAPITQSLYNLPNDIIKELTSKVNILAKKYSDTMEDIENQINDSSEKLVSLIDDLTGDDFDMSGLKELQNLLKGDKND